MISQSTLFLFILLIIGLIAKNQSLTVAIGVLFLLKFTFLGDKVFPYLQTKGINLGVTVITIAVLVPIATGEIGFKQLGEATKSYYAWIALASGVAVALLAKRWRTIINDRSSYYNCARFRDNYSSCFI